MYCMSSDVYQCEKMKGSDVHSKDERDKGKKKPIT